MIVSDKEGGYVEEFDDVYLLKLNIPKISFEMGIYDVENKLNDVDYNVEILENSDIDRNVYFFAGHAGNGDNCYFNRVKELDVGDSIYVKIDSEVLIYEVVDVYNIVKNGYMEVDGYLENVLYLITCSGYNRQLIVKGVLIN